MRKNWKDWSPRPINDPTVGPAFADGTRCGGVFHEVFGHRAEGTAKRT